MKRKLTVWFLAFFLTGCVFSAQAYADESEVRISNDPAAPEQWALYNDGTFTMEEEKNRYPVYDNPFGSPQDPGMWRPGAVKTDLVGVLVEVERIRAKAGIDINIADAWNTYGTGKRDVVIAMIDTGIDISHEDLAGSIWVNEGEIPDNGADDDGNGYIDDVNGWNFCDNSGQVYVGEEDSHGTHGAGTILAGVGNGVGIAGAVPGNRVRIMPVKTLSGEDGEGSTAALIRAIAYAQNNGAVICNLSLTSRVNDPALYQAMANSSMLFVVAAGNGDESTGQGMNIDEIPFYPASYDLDNMIVTANLMCDGNLHESSNYGAVSVDLAAPGSYILSTTPQNTYGYMTGTSMAAPMVSAAAAMVYSHFDGITAADVREILLNSVTPLESLSGKTATGGMLNVGAALRYDLSSLSGAGFQKGGKVSENGTAPYLEARTREVLGQLHLIIRAVDIDGDLETLLYAPGERAKEEFSGDIGSMEFSVNDKDIATFRIDNPGTYTFYAADRRGNSSVYTVKIADMRDGPGALD